MKKYKIVSEVKDDTPGFRDSYIRTISVHNTKEEAEQKLKELSTPIRSNKPKHLFTEMENPSYISNDYEIVEIEE